jgi:hypothetical protein
LARIPFKPKNKYAPASFEDACCHMRIFLQTGYSMRMSGYWLQRLISGSLILLLAGPFWQMAAAQQQQTPPNPQTESTSSAQTQLSSSDHEIKTPATDTAQAEASPGHSGGLDSQTTDTQQSNSAQTAPQNQKNDTSEPKGTAAAPYEKVTGVAASRPAGAAIAPAKQRRTQAILIKTSLLLGAAIAIGTVVALSHASPSQPH